MNLRKIINNSPVLVGAVVLAGLVACGWVTWTEVRPVGPKIETAAYFTVDEGKTWFVDDIGKVPPFDRDGKLAVRVRLFKCEGKSEPVVGYLERYTDKGKAVYDKYRAEQKANPGVKQPSLGQVIALGLGATEVKRPGDTTWVNKTQSEAAKIIDIVCSSGQAVAVIP